MDGHGAVEVGLGGPHRDGDADELDHFAGPVAHDVDSEHPVIRSLVARGRLEPVQSAPAAAPVPKAPKAPKGDSSKGDSTAKGDK